MKNLINIVSQYKQFYIIGTSTDVGKTYVGCSLLKSLLKKNPNFLPLKPIETGLKGNDWGPDTMSYYSILKENNIDIECSELNKYQVNEPCSPHLSYELENKTFCVDDIIDFCSHKKQSFIELAGGLMVPINESETQLDLIKKLPLPIVLIAHAGLGTLNHVLLTMNHLSFINDIHIVLNFYNKSNLIHRTNYEYLQKRFNVYTLTEV